MTSDIPSDLLEFLKSVVDCNTEEYSIDIEDFDGKGEGFIGDVIFLTLIKNKTKERQDIVIKQQKLLNDKPLRLSILTFDNEIYFYNSIWSTLNSFYEESIRKTISFVPKCLGTQRDGLKRVALENLLFQGFNIFDKRKPFDDEHFSLILKTYGVFHAISLALKEEKPDEFERLTCSLHKINEIDWNDETYGGKLLKSVSREFQNYVNQKDDILLDKLKLYEKTGPKIVDVSYTQGKLDGVILHGDCWSNNYMFKYDKSGKLEDLRMLDFQFSIVGSPVFDISYCIYSGASLETLQKLDHYLKGYHSSLTETLREFGLDAEKIYSYNKFKEEWKKYCKVGYALGIMLWTTKLADKEAVEVAEPEDFKPFKIEEGLQEVYKEIIKDLIMHMHENDFL